MIFFIEIFDVEVIVSMDDEMSVKMTNHFTGNHFNCRLPVWGKSFNFLGPKLYNLLFKLIAALSRYLGMARFNRQSDFRNILRLKKLHSD